MHNEDDSALICLDQSKAYEIVNHQILLRKLTAIGFTRQATEIMKSFLSERKQYVQIQAMKSESLLTGPQSIVQGSSISCVLFLIYVLDLPQIFHDQSHTPEENLNCKQPNAKTFVDDIGIVVTKPKNNDSKSMKELVGQTMDRVAEYTTANRLLLNQEKSLIMLVTKNKELKSNFLNRTRRKNCRSQIVNQSPRQYFVGRFDLGSTRQN